MTIPSALPPHPSSCSFRTFNGPPIDWSPIDELNDPPYNLFWNSPVQRAGLVVRTLILANSIGGHRRSKIKYPAIVGGGSLVKAAMNKNTKITVLLALAMAVAAGCGLAPQPDAATAGPGAPDPERGRYLVTIIGCDATIATRRGKWVRRARSRT